MNCKFTLATFFLTLLVAMAVPGWTQEYRSIDGTGNNLQNPDWGAAHTALINMSPPRFSDGISAPTGTNRPNPRTISNRLFAQNDILINDPTSMSDYTWVFGQFIDHDLTLVFDGDEMAMIDVPAGDPWFDPMNTGQVVIPMRRSMVMEGTGTDENNPRRFPNAITAFLDGSAVYGSEQEHADWLRTFSDGKMKISSGNLLPYNTVDGELDSEIDPTAPHMEDAVGLSPKHFVAGDVRVNENPLLVAFHTIFVREHNRLCDELKEKYPDWNDEQLYQYARKMVGGIIQAIVYEEWLPAMGVRVPRYEGYKPDVHPGVSNVFSAAAFRMGHTLLNGNILMMTNDGEPMEDGGMSLREVFFNLEPIQQYGIEPFFKGMGVQVQQRFDSKVVDDVRNFLFGPPGAGGLDLVSININRGRERGLADFNTIRQSVGLPPYLFFQQVNSDPVVFTTLQTLYGNINNIDPWVGMLAEERMSGALFGPTVTRIMAMQFANIRDGDRFYYENDPSIFPEDREAIKKTRMVNVVMRNTDIDLMQANVFNSMLHEDICPLYTVEGEVFTEMGTPVDAVTFQLKKQNVRPTEYFTNETGAFHFYPVDGCRRYEVYPRKDDNHRQGISTLDLVLLQRHILNVTPLDSPYKRIAADVNNSGSITTFDLVSLRKLILEIDTRFTDNTSWRFVPANYLFPDPENPFETPFPEYAHTDTLASDFRQNFIAIKVGDLNNSAVSDQLLNPEGRSQSELTLATTDRLLPAGETQTISLRLPTALQGTQFALEYDEQNLEIVGLNSNLPGWADGNFYQKDDEHTIRISWYHPEGTQLDVDQTYELQIQVRPRRATQLSEALRLNPVVLSAEAYTDGAGVHDLRLEFTPEVPTLASAANLYQNFPNPFQDATTIRFELPQAMPAQFRVLDASGRVLYTMQSNFPEGMNEINLTKSQLQYATGVLYYQLQMGEEVLTRSMVITE